MKQWYVLHVLLCSYEDIRIYIYIYVCIQEIKIINSQANSRLKLHTKEKQNRVIMSGKRTKNPYLHVCNANSDDRSRRNLKSRLWVNELIMIGQHKCWTDKVSVCVCVCVCAQSQAVTLKQIVTDMSVCLSTLILHNTIHQAFYGIVSGLLSLLLFALNIYGWLLPMIYSHIAYLAAELYSLSASFAISVSLSPGCSFLACLCDSVLYIPLMPVPKFIAEIANHSSKSNTPFPENSGSVIIMLMSFSNFSKWASMSPSCIHCV